MDCNGVEISLSASSDKVPKQQSIDNGYSIQTPPRMTIMSGGCLLENNNLSLGTRLQNHPGGSIVSQASLFFHGGGARRGREGKKSLVT